MIDILIWVCRLWQESRVVWEWSVKGPTIQSYVAEYHVILHYYFIMQMTRDQGHSVSYSTM